MNNTSNNGNQLTQTKHCQQQIGSISFDSSASLDLHGVLMLQSKIRNKSSTKKFKVRVLLTVMNAGYVVYELDSDYITLHGTISSVFVPSKKSSTTVNKYGSVYFDDLSVEDPQGNVNNEDIKKMDKDISTLAAQIRRIKILSEASSEGQDDLKKQYKDLVSQMAALKDSRMRKLKDLEFLAKFQSITINIQHDVVNV